MNYFEHNVPYIIMRMFSATFGALLCPLVYLICKNVGLSNWISSLAATLVTFDNSLICVSRLIMLDSQLIFSVCFTLYSYVKFMQLKLNPFTKYWWRWLFITGFSLGTTISIKMVGLFTITTIGVAVIVDLWNLIDIKRNLTQSTINRHFFARVYGLILTPLIVYLFTFYIHFIILNTSGPGDDFMSTDFQSTLKGNDLYRNSLYIKYGDVIHLKHKDSKTFLNSHDLFYPLRYPDGRISTAGQQVTSIDNKANSTRWRIIKPSLDISYYLNNTSLNFNETQYENDKNQTSQIIDSTEQIKNGDIVQLMHVDTNSILLTHDVASPLMPTNEEITTIKQDKLQERYKDTLFEINVHNLNSKKPVKSLMHEFKILHVETNVAVWVSNNKLPEWGLEQNEINGNKRIGDASNLWFVESIENRNASFENPVKNPIKLGFFKKFFEMQYKMIEKNSRISSSHPFSTRPHEWFLLLRGTSYWTNDKESRQIYILGNPIGWWICSILLTIALGLILSEIYLKRRGINILNLGIYLFLIYIEKQKRLKSFGYFIVFAYLIHFVPFYVFARQLFLHHYFPALVMKYIIASGLIQYFTHETIDTVVKKPHVLHNQVNLCGRNINHYESTTLLPCRTGFKTKLLILFLMILHVVSFLYFSPLAYGFPSLSSNEIKKRKWISSWDFSYL